MTTKTTTTKSNKSKKKFQPLTVAQCFAKVKSAMEQRHESFMDAARYMHSAFVQFTEVDGHKACRFWTLARKSTGLTKARCEGLIAAHKNFTGLSPEAGSHIDDAAYHYARLVSPAVIKKMISTARRGNAVGLTEVRYLHRKDLGEPMSRTGFTLVIRVSKGKELRFSHSTSENVTASQLQRQIDNSTDWEVTQNTMGRKAA